MGLSFDTAVLRAAAGSDALVGDAAGLWDTARQAKFPGALLPVVADGTLAIYAVAESGLEWRKLQPLLLAFAGPTLTNFTGAPSPLDPAQGFEALLGGAGVHSAVSLAMPKNAATHRRYSGINVLILWGAVIEHGFTGQSWLTFRQALSLGGHVRKGERGTTVVFADRFTPDDEHRRAAETGEEAQAIPFLKRFTVFNTAQCEGLPDEMMAVAPPVETGLVLPEAEALIRATGVDFRIGGERAFYDPRHDFIHYLNSQFVSSSFH